MSSGLPIALGITGASGAPYWARLLEVLLDADREVHLTASSNADDVCKAETGMGMDEVIERAIAGAAGRGTLRRFEKNDFYAPMASGTARYQGMAIVPCSMGTLGRIANAMSDNLLTRAADVMLKERRRLVFLSRETPLSLVHLRNMTQLTEAGAVVMPASPGFYYRPTTIEELVDFMVQRVCDHLDVEVSVAKRWGQE